MDKLKELYYNPKTGFKSGKRLYEEAKRNNLGLTRKQVMDFVKENETEQVFQKPKPPRGRGKDLPIFGRIGHYQADLTFLEQYKRQNKGYIGFLVLIEVNSKMAYAFPIKNKKKETIFEILQEAKTDPPIKTIQTDNGGEFSLMSKLVSATDTHVKHETCIAGDKKCLGVAERFNRTIKSMLSRYMKAGDTAKWYVALDDIVENYNNSFHSKLGKPPSEITEEEERLIIGDAIEEHVEAAKVPPARVCGVGDKVRLKLKKGKFDKEGANFSDKVYTIEKVNKKSLKIADVVGKLYKFEDVLHVGEPQDLQSGRIEEAKAEAKTMRNIKKTGLTEADVLLSKANTKLKQLIKDGIVKKGDIEEIKISTIPTKKLMVRLKDSKTPIHFGQKDSITFLEGASEEKRLAYRARASKIKNKAGRFTYKIPYTANFLSFHILW